MRLAKDACLRKAKEELGIGLRIGQLVSVEESIFSEENPAVHTVNIVIHMFFDEAEKLSSMNLLLTIPGAIPSIII